MSQIYNDVPVKLSENARAVLEERYLNKDESGNVVETPEQLFRRVASAVSQAELNYGATEEERQTWEDRFYAMMASLDFLPNSPTIRNAGTDQNLSGCFVIPFEDDSMEGILKAHNQCAHVIKSGGGIGLDFSPLRPRGNNIRSTHKGACGPVSVMRHINDLGETFTQAAGSFRKAAMMFILRVDHPDIFEFITCKNDHVSITNANISVAVTDEFVEALNRADDSFDLKFNGKVYETIHARELWGNIAISAWNTGDPGLFFVDRVNGRANPIEHVSKIASTNPCGEVPLLPYESCNLGSINLAKFARPDGTYSAFDLHDIATFALRFLEDVVEVNHMPTPETDAANKSSRRVGLGVMGLADALAIMKIPYDSEKGVEVAGKLMSTVKLAADQESYRLTSERGTYGSYRGSTHELVGAPYRNAFRTVIAPTGTISIIADCSSGIEPYFALEWSRNMEGGRVLDQKALGYDIWLNNRKPNEAKPAYLKVASEIDPSWHLRMQAVVQRNVDSAVSKTINLPKWSTAEEIEAIYTAALESGCKGVTVFRDGCRDKQVLNAKHDDSANSCPECSGRTIHASGCESCPSCGWSACEI